MDGSKLVVEPIDRTEAFLAELTALSLRYRIGLGGDVVMFDLGEDDLGCRYEACGSKQSLRNLAEGRGAFEPGLPRRR